jgi:glycosyltransferase involved in cell wall biosynthesis
MTTGRAGTIHVVAYSDAREYGGAEESLANLLESLGPRYRVTVVGTSEEIVRRIAARRPRTATVVLPEAGRKSDVAAGLAHVRALRRLRSDICHINLRTPYSCQFGLLAAVLAPGTRVVAVEHLPMHSGSAFRRRLRRLLVSQVDAHISVGVRAAREIETELGLATGSVETIHNGVREHSISSSSSHEAGAPYVVGSIGRLSWQKGYDVLIDALARIPETEAVIVGEGPQRENLEQRARDAGVDGRLTLVGWSDDPRSYLSRFDAFVLPSRFEGFPLVILEAMLAGVPVIATDVGSVSESVKDGDTGILVEPEDAAALAHAISRTLADPELARRIGEHGRQVALGRFTSRDMAESFERVYERLVP